MTAITISGIGKYMRNQRLTKRPTRLRGARAGPLGTLGGAAPPHLGPQVRGSVKNIHDVNGGRDRKRGSLDFSAPVRLACIRSTFP